MISLLQIDCQSNKSNIMRKFMLFAVVSLLFSISMSAQTDQPLKTYAFCELVGTSNLLGTKVTVQIDFGQKKGFFQSNVLLDENGKAVKFNSMIDAMNSMGAKGWEFVQAFAVTMQQSNVYHYILKKEVTPEELNTINSAKEE